MPMKKKTRKKTTTATERGKGKPMGDKNHAVRHDQWKDSAAAARVRSAHESSGASGNTGKKFRGQ
jgi:hypothetical protein